MHSNLNDLNEQKNHYWTKSIFRIIMQYLIYLSILFIVKRQQLMSNLHKRKYFKNTVVILFLGSYFLEINLFCLLGLFIFEKELNKCTGSVSLTPRLHQIASCRVHCRDGVSSNISAMMAIFFNCLS